MQRLSDLICLEHGLSVIVPAPYGQRKKRTEFPKRPKIRDNIKADIDAILSQKPKDYDAFLQKLRDCGYEVKLGKHVAVKGKSQQRFIRLKSLGADYTAESIKGKILGTDAVVSNDNKQTRDMNLLIDIDAKMREGKNGGYITWAKRHNNKQFAQTIMFLQDHKVSDFDEICKRADESAEVFHEISNKIKALNSEIKKLANIRSAIINYSKTRDVYVAYRKSGYSPKYLEKYREEIMLHRAAKDVFSNMDGKIPKVKDLNAKIKELAAEKGKLYSEYHSYKKEMKDWQIAKQNIEEYLGFNNEHEKEKDENLLEALPQALQQRVALVEERKQLEDAEDADQTDASQHNDETRARQQPAQIHGQDGNEVDDTEKAEGVGTRSGRTIEPRQIFEREEKREQILHHDQRADNPRIHENRVENRDQDAQGDAKHEHDVEHLAHRCLAAEDDFVELPFKRLIGHQLLPTLLDCHIIMQKVDSSDRIGEKKAGKVRYDARKAAFPTATEPRFPTAKVVFLS